MASSERDDGRGRLDFPGAEAEPPGRPDGDAEPGEPDDAPVARPSDGRDAAGDDGRPRGQQ